MTSESQIFSVRDLRAIVLMAFAPALIATVLLLHHLVPSSLLLWFWSILLLPIAVIVLKFDYLNPLLALLLPWIGITLFGTLDISKYARPISEKTYSLLLAVEIAAVIAYYLSAVSEKHYRPSQQTWVIRPKVYRALIVSYIALTIFNVVAAGYVPIIRGLQTGDTGYLDFGVHSIYGFYNAFANALGILSIYLYLKTRRRGYLLSWGLILVVFTIFVTRQNVVSMLVESFVVYCFVRGRVRLRNLAIATAVVLVLFGVAGNLRSGDIKAIAGVTEEYRNLPDAAVWVYAYGYFNVLNLDNLVMNPQVPTYNGSSLLGLLPSVFRPNVSYYEDVLEVEAFNVLSFIAPIYADVGLLGCVLFTAAVVWWSGRSYQEANEERSFYAITKYAVLFFCALFSFFVNLWLYLPIIAQIIFLKGFSKYLLRPEDSISDETGRLKVPALSR
jgi:oligosaccharide repeat unit polymerase